MGWLQGGFSSDRPLRRLSLALLMALVVAVAVSACGGSDSSSSGGASSESTTAGGEAGGESTEASGEEGSGVQGDSDPVAAMEALYEGYSGDEAGLPTEYPEPKPGKATIGWLNPFGAQAVLATQQEGAEAQVAKLGGTIKTADDKLEPNKQVSDFETMLNQKADAIELIPIDPGATKPLLQQAEAAKVPVFAFDQTHTSAESAAGISTQIWQGRDHQAYAMAKYTSEVAPEGKIGLIGFGLPVPNIEYLMERLNFWAKKFGLDVVGEVQSKSDDASGGEGAMQGLLKENVAGLICYTDQVCVGASAAAKQAGQQIVNVAVGGGPGGVEAVKNGQLSATLQTDAVQQGAQAVNGMYDLIQGIKVPPVVLRAPRQLVDEDTVENVVDWEAELSELNGN